MAVSLFQNQVLSQEEIDALVAAIEADRILVRFRQGLAPTPSVAAKETQASLDEIVQAVGRIAPLQTYVLARCQKSEGFGSWADLDEAITEVGEEVFRQAVAESVAQVEQMAEAAREGHRPRQRIITGYDFRHPARINKDQLRALENLHDNFARLLSSTLSGAMRMRVDVDTAFVDQTTYAEFIASLSNPSCSYRFTLGPTNGQAIIDFAMPVVFAFVDRIFGGKGSSSGIDARQLTPIETGVINRILKRVIEDLETAWQPILRAGITDIELGTNPGFMQITAASEIVILLAFEVNSVNASGLVSLCYPFFTLESILPRLGQQSYERGPRIDHGVPQAANRSRLALTEVPLRVELGRGQLSLGEARRLQVGDVVLSEAHCDDPAVVFVGDEPKLLARPCAGDNGHIKVRVAGTIPPEWEEHFRNRCRPLHD